MCKKFDLKMQSIQIQDSVKCAGWYYAFDMVSTRKIHWTNLSDRLHSAPAAVPVPQDGKCHNYVEMKELCESQRSKSM